MAPTETAMTVYIVFIAVPECPLNIRGIYLTELEAAEAQDALCSENYKPQIEALDVGVRLNETLHWSRYSPAEIY